MTEPQVTFTKKLVEIGHGVPENEVYSRRLLTRDGRTDTQTC